jgi:DNA processing protein
MTPDPNREGWVALNCVRGLTPRLATLLLERFGDPAGIARSAGAAGLFGADAPSGSDALAGLGPLGESTLRDLRELGSEAARRRARLEIERAEALGARIVTRGEPGYPARLGLGVPDPPPALYVRGEIHPQDAGAVAIVGSRMATPYGLEVARRLAGDLAEEGYTIVSGLARGIDAAAHRGALEAGGRTLAVLGCGIDRIYPRSHAELAGAVARRGAVISEFPLGTAPLKPRFPIRNRLISGLSLAVVVVEAAERSGSLITARLAMEQGREVGAVPGPVTSPASAGTNKLLIDGATLVRTWRDVAEAIPEELRPPARDRKTVPEDLGERARRILEALSPEAPRHVDTLARELRSGAGELLADLLDLELRRLVVSLPGGHFLRRT